MCKSVKMCDSAARMAVGSKALYRLGAVITKGRRILCKGRNHDRTRIMGCHECHAHAEMVVAHKFLNTHNIYDVPWYQLKGSTVEGAS